MFDDGADLAHVAVAVLAVPHGVHDLIIDATIIARRNDVADRKGSMVAEHLTIVLLKGPTVVPVKAREAVTDVFSAAVHRDPARIAVAVVALIDLDHQSRIGEDDIEAEVIVGPLLRLTRWWPTRPRRDNLFT